jgi:hypothetical protein
VGGCAPPALKDSMRRRRLSGRCARPLNFTVRAHEVGLGIRRQDRGVQDASAKASFDDVACARLGAAGACV